MRVSTKGRYAIRFMLDLALHNTGEPVRIKDVSGRQGISDKYLEQVVSILNKAGFVRSIRGPQGGYVLTRDPKDYTMGQILRLTAGDDWRRSRYKPHNEGEQHHGRNSGPPAPCEIFCKLQGQNLLCLFGLLLSEYERRRIL